MMNLCPSVETLERFLAGELTDAAAAELATHVEGCGACQHALEELTVADSVQEVFAALRAYPKTPAARKVTQAQAKWRKAS